MRVPAGESWLLVELVSPGNFGSGEGRADIDRPTVKDPELGLPYIPHSVIKGVVAGGHGDIDEGNFEASRAREARYGSPDRPDRPGEPGPVVFGDGDLLSFPLPGANGSRVSVFVAPVLARCLADSRPAEWEKGALKLLGLVERLARQGRKQTVVGDAGTEEGKTPRSWTWLDDERVQALWRSFRGKAEGWLGRQLGDRERVLVASGTAAAAGWELASERRMATAIDPERFTAADGSLRSMELCPAGTLFVSRLSVFETARAGRLDLSFPDRLQLGAREADGLGFCRLAVVQEEASPEREETRGVASAPARASDTPVREMAAMHQRVGAAAGERADVRKALKAVISHFGGRAHFQGLRNAVGFSLAKAKPGAPSATGPEPAAHRWLLETLLEPQEGLAAWARKPEVLETLEPRREAIFERWLWLRRYAELLLRGGEEGVQAPEGSGEGGGDA